MIERLTSISELPIDEIEIGARLRDVSPAGVSNMVEIIRANGFLGRVLVRRTKKGDVLLDGAHRLTAARELGMETIPCDVVRCNETEALALECDGNLGVTGLTSLQLAYFLSRKREAHQKLHPEARQGYASNAVQKGQTEFNSLCQSIAEERGITPRQVYRIMAAGDAIGPDEYRRLASAPNPVRLNDLEQIAKITQTGERYFVIDALAKGTAKKASAARKLYLAELGKGPSVQSPADGEHRRLMDAFKRAGKVARARFVRANADALRALLDELEGGEE